MLSGLVGSVTILIASEDELSLVASDPAADPDTEEARVTALLDAGVGEVVVKRGSAGATAYTKDDKVSAPARPVGVVDVVGAGDAFVVATRGDWDGLPTRAELTILDSAPGTTLR